MNVLELYSGIGGMHLAFQSSGVPGKVVFSVDINPTANTVYKHNFPNTTLLNGNIQNLTSNFINKLNIHCILMSPPCQPFTRNGLKEDINDARTKSFIHILNILPELNVQYILIENVKGFETSEMRNKLIHALTSAGFIYQEFILSPTQFGIPNTRHRYYCVAKKTPLVFKFKTGTIMTEVPENCNRIFELYPMCDILETDTEIQEYLISDAILEKRVMSLDICFPTSYRSCCFTKSYGRYVTGTGSVYTCKSKEQFDDVFKQLQKLEAGTREYLCCIKQLQLRFFTPKEVCRLMCFPESFGFPITVTNKQKYMLLGNSINIKVVSELIKLLCQYILFTVVDVESSQTI